MASYKWAVSPRTPFLIASHFLNIARADHLDCGTMADDPDYEPSIAPVAFSADWLGGFDSSWLHSTLMGTIPAPIVETDSEDCPFEYDEATLRGRK